MRRFALRGVAFCVLTSFFILGLVSLAKTDMNIKLLPIALEDAAAVRGVQLFERDGVQLMLVSGGTLSVLDASAQKPHLVPALDLESGGGWDARWAGGGFATIYQQAGSAVCWIMSKNSGAPVGTRINAEAFSVYVRPRFVRGDVEGFPLTAVKQESGTAHVVLFSRDPKTQAAVTRTIGNPMPSILDARLLHAADGYTLFTLAPPPDLGGSAGILFAQKFNDHLTPNGPATRILGNHPIHEFDVAQDPNGAYVIFATTPAGFLYARRILSGAPLGTEPWTETPSSSALSSPSLLIHNGSVFIAAIEGVGEPSARVLQARID